MTVVKGTDRDYLKRHPGPVETPLVIEVADTSLAEDRTDCARMYARDRIPIYWIVNLNDEQVEAYSAPTGPCDQPGYRQRQDYHRDEEIPLVLDGVEVGRIKVRELLP